MSLLEDIKKLREKSGAGMVDCKKAVEEAEGDLDKALEILRKKGITKATKRSDRETSEGIIVFYVNDDKTEGIMLEMNAETDFVARNEKFIKMSNDILDIIKEHKPKSIEDLLGLSMGDISVQENLNSLSGTIGEKMVIKNFDIVEGKTVAVYSHMNGQKGVLVSLDKEAKDELAYDIAMQVAASSPKYLNPEDVPEEELNKEKEIYKEQLLKEGKPENILDKIIQGKINKYFEEVCLLKQEYIKDDKKKVEDILGDTKIIKFVRYSL
jgi:elongation factor Ts